MKNKVLRFDFTRLWTSTLCMVIWAGALSAQTASSAEQVTRKVAEYIIENTSYTFIDIETKDVYTATHNVPPNANLKAASIYNKWEYSNGVMALGMMELGAALEDSVFLQYVGRNFGFVFDNLAYFKKQYETNPRAEFYNFLRMDRLDDCGALSAALVRYSETNPNRDFDAYLQQAADFVTNRQSRLPDGTLCRTAPRAMTIWADDLYMSVPFLAAMGEATGEHLYYDEAIKQVFQFNKYLYATPTGLYHHTWFSDVQSNGVAHWLRCNGWVALAQAQLIDKLPDTHPGRGELIRLLQRQITGYARYQDTTGLWHQLIDKPDSYLETSGSAMFVYTVAKAVNEGWIPASYLSIAKDGWEGLITKVTPEGQLQDVCIGTGVGNNIRFYYTRPVKLNDFHASGAFLLAGSEMIRAFRKEEQQSRK